MSRFLTIIVVSLILAACGAKNNNESSSSSSSSATSSSSTSSSSTSSSSTSSSSSSSGAVAQALCDESLTAKNKAAAIAALEGFFIQKNVSAIDQYWDSRYLQHNPLANSGVNAFKSFMVSFVTGSSFKYEILRAYAECDMVVIQGKYSGSGVIFDMFRMENGKLAEHWDSDSNQASSSDGPTEVEDRASTNQNRVTIENLYKELTTGNTSAINSYFSNAVTLRANPVLTGNTAFTQYLSSSKITYSKLHQVIADGNFVFTLAEGKLDGKNYGFYDLFRLDNGLVVEHWNSKRSVPTTTASGLGIF